MTKYDNVKGSKAEREVAGMIRTWWHQHEHKTPDGDVVEFVRTPKSGGWVFGPTFRACGDIMTNSRVFPFAVEVKRREQWSLPRLLQGNTSPVWGWWRQCQGDAKKMNVEPMLWFRHNRNQWLVMMRSRYCSSLIGIGAPDVVWPNRLRYDIEVGALPVVYLAQRVLEYPPSVFVKGK
jgi:hypothetical protein